MKRDRTGTPTERAIARLLTEPTGRHFLDSGDAYGRNWERNQGITRTMWAVQPEIWTDGVGSDVDEETGVETSDNRWPVLSLFHYLRQRLEFNSPLTAWLIREGSKTDDPWMASMEQWCEARHDGDRDAMWRLETYNSYNHENLLSQDIQFTTFTYRDTPYVALQVHGGADIRGGYTSPKVFAVTTDEPLSFMDWDTWSFGHTLEHTDTQEPLPTLPALPQPEQHTWDSERGSSSGWVEYGGSYVTMDEYASHGHLSDDKSLMWQRDASGLWRPRCPIDGALCDLWAPSAW